MVTLRHLQKYKFLRIEAINGYPLYHILIAVLYPKQQEKQKNVSKIPSQSSPKDVDALKYDQIQALQVI